jgi:DNA-binding transcriptional LysR family regulator
VPLILLKSAAVCVAARTPNRTQVVEYVQTAMALAAANAGFALVPESANRLSPCGVIFRPLNDVVPKFDTVALWLRGSTDPLVMRVGGNSQDKFAHGPDSRSWVTRSAFFDIKTSLIELV